MKKSFLFLLFCLFVSSFPVHARDAADALAEIPVQHNGRVKPFGSFAQEAVLVVTGRNQFAGMQPAGLVLHWIAEPQKWMAEPLLPVSYKPLRDELGVMVARGRISAEVLINNESFVAAARQAVERRQKKETLSFMDRKRIDLYEKALSLQEIADGNTPGWVANPEDVRSGWLPSHALLSDEGKKFLESFFNPAKVARVQKGLEALLETVRSGKDPGAQSVEYAASLKELFESRDILLNQGVLNAEIRYNKLRPFHLAWPLYLFASVILFVLIATANAGGAPVKIAGAPRIPVVVALVCFAAGCALHIYGFYLRCLVAGRPPVTNMYESMIWVSFAVAFFSLILFGVYRALMIPATSGLVAGIALLLAQSFPAFLDPSITPLVPVLRSNFWLTIHVLTITLSYGAFMLSWGLGHAVIFKFAFSPVRTESHRWLAAFLYRSLQIGVILLATGTVLGGVWANYSWGRFWGWDPKETWALIALLGYLAVLHGRFTGMLGTFGVAVGSVVAFLGVIMAWYGVNFVLAAGLHSYGFGGGGTPYVIGAALADLVLVGILAAIYKNGRKEAVANR